MGEPRASAAESAKPVGGPYAYAVLYGMLMTLVGVPVSIWVKADRGEYGPGGGRTRATAAKTLI